MIKLRITSDGSIRGLWTDDVQWREVGVVHVRRASHVEFDDRRQCWAVREARPSDWLRRFAQRLLGRPLGRELHAAPTREQAIEWETEFFSPGGPGWRRLSGRGRQ